MTIKRLPLKSGGFVQVDPDVAEWASKTPWTYASYGPALRVRRVGGGRESLAHLILAAAGRRIFFVNGDALDCRRENIMASSSYSQDQVKEYARLSGSPTYEKAAQALRNAAFRSTDKGKRAACREKIRRKSPERRKKTRDGEILRRTGWCPGRAEERMATQLGLCAICGLQLDLGGVSGLSRACRDHCHFTGKPRGLLCLQCNTHLGGYEKSLASGQRIRLSEFDAYLEFWT